MSRRIGSGSIGATTMEVTWLPGCMDPKRKPIYRPICMHIADVNCPHCNPKRDKKIIL
jgi:hypothetical protein